MKTKLFSFLMMSAALVFANPAHADDYDTFNKVTSTGVTQSEGIYFKWSQVRPTPGASFVDAKDMMVITKDLSLRLNVQMDYEGTDFANCQQKEGTKGAWKNDLAGESIITWHETMICRNIDVKGSDQDLLVQLDLEGQTGTIEITGITKPLSIKMDLQRK